MQKVLMFIFIIMHITFIVGYFINSGIVFLSNYFWLVFSIITFCVGMHYLLTSSKETAQDKFYRVVSTMLVIISTISFLFIIFIGLFQPYFYLEIR